MTLSALSEKRNQLWSQISTLLQGDVTTETRTKYDALMADVNTIDGDIARLEAVERHNAEMRNVQHSPRPNPGESNDPVENVEVRNQKQRAAFRDFLRSGVVDTNVLRSTERRDLIASGTAVAIPVGFNPQVIEAQLSYGELYNLVDVIKTDNGEPIKYVYDDDTANGLTAVTSGTDAAETDPTLTGASINVDNFTTGVVKIDMALLQDSGFDIDSWVRDRFALRFFRGASSLIWNGNGANVAALKLAIPASGSGQSFTSAGTAALAYADFAKAIGSLDPAFQPGAEWGMCNATLGYVASLTDSNGRPLFLPDYGSAAKGFPGTILGRPVRIIQQMSTVATGNVAVLFGDFKKSYVFRQVNPGLGILRLNERYAPSFEVGFVAFARVGGLSKLIGAQKAILGITIK